VRKREEKLKPRRKTVSLICMLRDPVPNASKHINKKVAEEERERERY